MYSIWHYYRTKSSDSGSGFYHQLATRASSAAMSWFTPVVSWFGGWISDDSQRVGSCRRSAASQLAESLLMEVIQQGRLLEEQQNICREQEVLASGAVDYRYSM